MTIGLVILACVASIIAALMTGLWLGERGRRKQTEAFLVTGTPERRPAQRIGVEVAAEDLAARAGRPPFSESTIKKGVEKHLAEMREAGFNLTEAEARQHVETMLYQSATGGPEPDEFSGLLR